MAKRFTDTGKWDKAWFRKLGSKLRDIRQYVLDRCDHAGIIEFDPETFKHYLGEPVTVDEISAAFCGKIKIVGEKIFIPDYIEFQYKVPIDALNPENKVHFSVLQLLKKLGLASPLQGAKEKNKDKDQDKEKDRLLSEKEIYLSLPIITRDRLQQKYNAAFIEEGVGEAVTYHSSDPASPHWPPIKWGKIITSWLAEKKRRDDKSERDKGVDTFSGVAE